jgi:hypothetical protein
LWGSKKNLGIIAGYVVEKKEESSDFHKDKSLMLFIIERKFCYTNKYGKKIILFRTYDFLWIYNVLITKTTANKKLNFKILKGKKNPNKNKTADLIYSDIIHYKIFNIGGKFFEY